MMDHGEDKTSYERNETMLKSQYSKKDHNEDVIKKLMEPTWEGRHYYIYSNPMDVLQLLVKYPYLSEKDYISVTPSLYNTCTYVQARI